MIVLIPTCPQYIDILPIFVYFFNKFWADCPFRKVFINSPINFDGFENFNYGNMGWIQRILTFIEKEKINENILLLLDDSLLLQNINSDQIKQIDGDTKGKIGYIRLILYSDNAYCSGYGGLWPSKESYSELYNYADIDKHGKLTRLPISHQPAIWNIDFVKTYFNMDLSPWQQEVLGSREYCQKGTIKGIPCDYTFLTVKSPIFSYCNALRDGKYSLEFIDLIGKTKDLQPFTLERDIVIPLDKSDKKIRNDLQRRQLDGSYPEKRYPINNL